MSLGLPEVVVIFVVALLVFGPRKLPELGRQLGRAMTEFRRASNEFKWQLEEEMRHLEADDRPSRASRTGAGSAPEAPTIAPPEGTVSSRPGEAAENGSGGSPADPPAAPEAAPRPEDKRPDA